jgi:hypothetical protein
MSQPPADFFVVMVFFIVAAACANKWQDVTCEGRAEFFCVLLQTYNLSLSKCLMVF